jgi:hypothetical protein
MRLAKLVSSGGSLLEAAFREHKGEFCVGDFPGDFRVGDIRAGELCERDLAQETIAKDAVVPTQSQRHCRCN